MKSRYDQPLMDDLLAISEWADRAYDGAKNEEPKQIRGDLAKVKARLESALLSLADV